MQSSQPPELGLQKDLQTIFNLQRDGQHSDAISICRKIISQNIKNNTLYYYYSFSLYMTGNIIDAIKYLDLAIQSDPINTRYSELYAIIAYDLGEFEKSIELLTMIITEFPDNFYHWNLLTRSLLDGGRLLEARDAAKRLLELGPNKAEAYFTSAEVAFALENYTLAALGYDEGMLHLENIDMHIAARRFEIALEAGDGDFIENNITKYMHLPFHEDFFIRIIQVYTRYLFTQRRVKDALKLLDSMYNEFPKRAMQIDMSKAYIYKQCNQIDKAMKIYEDRLKISPGESSSRFQLALCQLASGKIHEGFKNYEARWEGSSVFKEKRDLEIPMWNGEALEERRILIWGEQGIGDQIRFASLIQHFFDSALFVRIECTPKLIPLFSLAFPQAEIESRYTIDDEKFFYNKFDYHIPMGSLPLVVGAQHFDSNLLQPWLPSDRERESIFRTRFSSDENVRVIGLCWRSGNLTKGREINYLTASCLTEFSKEKNMKFVILQHDAIDHEIKILEEAGLDVVWPTDVDQKNDLLETRNIIGACDVVVTVNCAVCDLAGSMGVPTIMITPEGTWILFGRTENPWHPNSVAVPFELINPIESIKGAINHIHTTFKKSSWMARKRPS